tara:strand:+ start:795 stop:2744 length:1950 start_codon:yes stop_codon:yes gene_type:complete
MSIVSKNNNSNLLNRYRPEIDGLRAFAVVAVIINHFNKEILPNGYLGVDIFFVISGFVITSSLHQRSSKNFKDFISGFYERRVKRLIPALSVFVISTSFAICLVNPLPGLSLITGLTSLFGLSNIYLLKESTDYFAQSTELNVFTQTWSLGVEEQFYILFPFLIWFSGFGRQTKNGSRNLFLTVGTLTIISLIAFIYLYPKNQSAAYFLMPTRFWEMASGCLLFILLQKKTYIKHLLERLPPLISLILIIGVMYLPISFGRISTIATVSLSVLLIASLKKGTKTYKFFTNTKVVYTGLISYSLYLWHWGILSLSRWTIGVHWWSIPLQVALMFGFAVLSYENIETPFRKGKWLKKRWQSLLIGFGAILTVSGGLITLGKPLKGKFYLGKFDIKDFTNVQDGMECELFGNNPTNEPLKCIEGDYDKNTIYIFGNSHASNLVKITENSMKEMKYDNLKYLTNKNNFYDKKSLNMTNWYEDENINSILSRTSEDDLIIWSHSRVPKNQKRILDIANQLEYLVNLSKKTRVPILIVDDIVSFGGGHNFFPKFSFYRDGPSISLLEATKNRNSFTNLLLKYSNENNQIYYFDPLPYLCPKNLCKSVIDGQLIYADGSPHFSKSKISEILLSEPLRKKLLNISNFNIEKETKYQN